MVSATFCISQRGVGGTTYPGTGCTLKPFEINLFNGGDEM
jgi:hypothetical protein